VVWQYVSRIRNFGLYLLFDPTLPTIMHLLTFKLGGYFVHYTCLD